MKIKERFHIRKDIGQELKEEIESSAPIFSKLIPEKGNIEVARTEEDDELIIINGEPLFFKYGNNYYPSVKAALEVDIEDRFVTVDKGAVAYVIKGADIMRPGIVEFDSSIKKGDIVVVMEHEHRKPLGIGVSVWEGKDFSRKKNGKCIKNLHHVGDKLWNLEI